MGLDDLLRSSHETENDITVMEGVERHKELITSSDFLFLDAAKDGQMEQRLLDNFETLQFTKDPVMVFDDIKVWNMSDVWRKISRPRHDISCMGHWSGTGLIDWNG